MAIQQRPINGKSALNDGRTRPCAATFLRAVLVSLFALTLAACGGGGGDSPRTSTGTSGYVAKGPVTGATASLYSVAVNGAKTLLGTAVTDATGAYQINVTPPPGTVLLVEAAGGTYLDEVSQQPTALAGNFRAIGVGNGAAMRMSISPFSEAVVAEIAATAPGDWSAARVQTTNTAMSDWVGVANLLDFRPVNFLGASAQQNAAAASDDDFFMSLQLGGFSGFLGRLGSPASVAQGVQVLRTAVTDPDDDRYATRYLMGLLDFIDATGLSPTYKRAVKGILILDNEFATDAQINAALPTGQATGSASAPMPDDAFEVVPDLNMARQWPIKTDFNGRGALVKYQLSVSDPDFYRVIHTASVGEVFGDGEIGIGRWHGGLVTDLVYENGGERIVNRQFHPATDGLPYAVAIPATNTPSCGTRTLQLAASTLPVQSAGSGNKPVTGLTQDSRIAVQYLGASAFVGLDIGLQLSDGSVFRVVTRGGLSAPWSSGFSVAPDRSFNMSTTPATPPVALPGLRLDANGTLAGLGGRKAALMFRIYSTAVDAETLAAAFVAPDSPPDAGGCAVTTEGDGSTISPPPTAGTYFVFAGAALSQSLFLGAPISADFHGNGALKSAGGDLGSPILSIPAGTPVFGLAGNTDAAIGRAKGPFTLRNSSYNLSLPFAVAKAHPDGSYPRSGSRRYRLLNASAPFVFVSANGGVTDLASGQVTLATLEMKFDEYPAGTTSPWYGSANVRVEGTAGGASFTVAIPDNRSLQGSGGFSGNNETGSIAGSMAGDAFEYAVVSYTHGAGNGTVHGVLLFEAE